MKALVRIFVVILLLATAVWTTRGWAGDPHLDAPREDAEWDEESSDDWELGDETEENRPAPEASGSLIAVPERPSKPAVPALFAAAGEIFQEWKSPTLPETEAPKVAAPSRVPASKVDPETQEMTSEAMEKEKLFQEHVREATVAPETYREILKVLSSGTVRPRRVEDNGR